MNSVSYRCISATSPELVPYSTSEFGDGRITASGLTEPELRIQICALKALLHELEFEIMAKSPGLRDG